MFLKRLGILEEPPADDPMLVSMTRFMLSGLLRPLNQTHDIEAKANKPSPLMLHWPNSLFLLDDIGEGALSR